MICFLTKAYKGLFGAMAICIAQVVSSPAETLQGLVSQQNTAPECLLNPMIRGFNAQSIYPV